MIIGVKVKVGDTDGAVVDGKKGADGRPSFQVLWEDGTRSVYDEHTIRPLLTGCNPEGFIDGLLAQCGARVHNIATPQPAHRQRMDVS